MSAPHCVTRKKFGFSKIQFARLAALHKAASHYVARTAHRSILESAFLSLIHFANGLALASCDTSWDFPVLVKAQKFKNLD